MCAIFVGSPFISLMNVILRSFLLTMFLLLLVMKAMAFSQNQHHLGSPFECGFERGLSRGNRFSMQFFTVTLVFLLFDLEIVLIMPSVLLERFTVLGAVLVSFIVVVLTLALLMEWGGGLIEWKS